jgi:hypothetical protein
MDHPLKFRTIFNLVTDVSIFTMYSLKVLKYLNIGTLSVKPLLMDVNTFDFFFPKYPSNSDFGDTPPDSNHISPEFDEI